MTDARARACVNVGKGKGAAKTEAKVRATRRAAARRDERANPRASFNGERARLGRSRVVVRLACGACV